MTPNPSQSLTAQQLFFELQAVEPLHLHAHNGSALRGMVYNAVRELADEPRGAPDVQFIHDPVLRRLLATMDEANSRGRDVPRPYVIEPPPSPPTPLPRGEGGGGEGHVLSPGETLTFGITLFGEAIEAFPIIVMAMKHGERRGLGRALTPTHLPGGEGRRGEGRGRFRLARAFAQNPLTRTSQEFLVPGARMVMTPQVHITHEDVMRQAELDSQSGALRMRVHFHTPMTLKSQGEVVREPRFNVLVHRLIERVSELSVHHGNGLLPILPADRDAKIALLRLADAVQLVENRTNWAALYGHSDRTGAPTNLSGLVGYADYVAPGRTGSPFSAFLPLLRWGELTHAGNHAVKGNGLFRIQLL